MIDAVPGDGPGQGSLERLAVVPVLAEKYLCGGLDVGKPGPAEGFTALLRVPPKRLVELEPESCLPVGQVCVPDAIGRLFGWAPAAAPPGRCNKASLRTQYSSDLAQPYSDVGKM